MNNDQYNEPDNGNDSQWNNNNGQWDNGNNNGQWNNGNGYNGNGYNNGYNDNYNPYQPQNTRGPEESVTISIIAMVLGIISLVFSCCYALSIMLGIAAIVLGIIGLKKEKKGKGFAIAGIVTGAVGLSFAIIMFVFELYLRQTGLYEELMNMYLDPNSSSWKSMR